jgi:hypothetical protein
MQAPTHTTRRGRPRKASPPSIPSGIAHDVPPFLSSYDLDAVSTYPVRMADFVTTFTAKVAAERAPPPAKDPDEAPPEDRAAALEAEMSIPEPEPEAVTRKAPAAVQRNYLPFAKWLREAMAQKGMTASDLAKAIWGTMKDTRGYAVARNRDRIGAYLTGTGFPNAKNLPELAAALGVKVEDIPSPGRGPTTAVREPTGPGDVIFSMLPDLPGMCLLRISKVLPIEVGIAICKQINDALKADRDKSPEDDGK